MSCCHESGAWKIVPEKILPLLSPLSALAVCYVSLQEEVTAAADDEASAPHDAAPVDMATPLPSGPDLTGEPSQCMCHASGIMLHA